MNDQSSQQIPHAPVMKKCAETEEHDVFKCPFCQRRMFLDRDEEHPDRCPWGCER